MKHFFSTLFLVLISSVLIIAQDFTWEWKNPLPFSFNLNSSVIFPDGKYMLFGDRSAVLKSSDMGQTWIFNILDTTHHRYIFGSYFFDNSNTGFICGHGGMICKTTDAGETWTYLNSGIGSMLFDIVFYDDNLGFAAGFYGIIIKTTDGGNTWYTVHSGTIGDEIHRLNIAPGTNGSVIYAGTNVGSYYNKKILKSVDTGETWFEVPGYTILNSGVRAICFADADTGYIANESFQIFKTTNGGTTFVQVADPGNGKVYDLKIISSGTIVGVGSNGSIIKSTDWGANWILYNLLNYESIYSFDFRDNEFIACGFSGTITRSTDSGITWELLSSYVTNRTIHDMQFAGEQVCFAVGQGEILTGIIIKSTDGGEHWQKLPFTSNHEFYTQFWFNENEGFIANNTDRVFHSTDGGATFHQISLNVSGYHKWNAISFANYDTGYLAGDQGKYFKTTDHGLTWSVIPSVFHHGTNGIRDLAVFDAQTVISVGWNGTIFKTTDGGLTFINLSISDTTKHFLKVDFYDENKGYAVGLNYNIYVTTNGGNDWTLRIEGLNAFETFSVLAESENRVWISGGSEIAYSTNSGTTWNVLTSFPVSEKMYALNIHNNALWLAGQGGVIIKGSSSLLVPAELISFTAEVTNNDVLIKWMTATEINNKGFAIERRIKDKWEKIGFVPGKGTTAEISEYKFRDKIYCTSSYRLKQIDYNGNYSYSNEIAVNPGIVLSYELKQNFPNPFNPTTIINYSIPFKSNVTIKIFDALGRGIATLVNEDKPAGSYTINFDALGLASGIYFYSIQAGDFLQSRKMILMK